MNSARNNRGSAALSSRLSAIMERRRATPVTKQTAEKNIRGTGVVKMADESQPVMEILQKARVLGRPPRKGEYVHVSDLIGKCLRKTALSESVGVNVASPGLSITDSITFSQGDAIHDVLKVRAVSGAPTRVWGNWQCKCETTSTTQPCTFSEVSPDWRCNACKGPINNYVEVPMRNDEYMVVGTPDLLILTEDFSAVFITELKSIAHDSWKELVRPDPDHVIQVVFYWYLMKSLGYRLTDKVSIVYATKGWMFSGSPCKEFVVDAEGQVGRLKLYLEEAKALKEARAGGKLPPRSCKTAQDSKARKCEVCNTCFASTDEKPITISIASALGGSTPVTRPAVKRRTPRTGP